MGDVIELVHPRPRDEAQSQLFSWLLDRRHHPDDVRVGPALTTVARNAELLALPVDQRRGLLDAPEALAAAGFTWERLSGWLQGPMDAAAWEAIIPSMGHMALLRNLRNFDQAGIGEASVAAVAARLRDPEQVARSRQLPLRFYSAWADVGSLRWGPVLEEALGHSLAGVPELVGRTLVLVDVSGSMTWGGFGRRSSVAPWQAAAVFAAAAGLRAEHADVVAYSNGHEPVQLGGSVLRAVDAIRNTGVFGGGTDTMGTLAARFDGHDRVVIVTDEQAHLSSWGTHRRVAKIAAPIYTFNIGGYAPAHLPSGAGNRYAFGGLSDAGFRALALLEAGRGGWGF